MPVPAGACPPRRRLRARGHAVYSSFVTTFFPSMVIDCLRLTPVCVTDGVPPALLPPITSDCELLPPLRDWKMFPDPASASPLPPVQIATDRIFAAPFNAFRQSALLTRPMPSTFFSTVLGSPT